jgi:hypothetical protein
MKRSMPRLQSIGGWTHTLVMGRTRERARPKPGSLAATRRPPITRRRESSQALRACYQQASRRAHRGQAPSDISADEAEPNNPELWFGTMLAICSSISLRRSQIPGRRWYGPSWKRAPGRRQSRAISASAASIPCASLGGVTPPPSPVSFDKRSEPDRMLADKRRKPVAAV